MNIRVPWEAENFISRRTVAWNQHFVSYSVSLKTRMASSKRETDANNYLQRYVDSWVTVRDAKRTVFVNKLKTATPVVGSRSGGSAMALKSRNSEASAATSGNGGNSKSEAPKVEEPQLGV
jgi:hypothetical protein